LGIEINQFFGNNSIWQTTTDSDQIW